MKLCSVVLVAVSVAFVCVDAATLEEFAITCLNENKCDMDTLKGNVANPYADARVKCTIDCICKKMGIMYADGRANRITIQVLMSGQTARHQKLMTPVLKRCLPLLKAGQAECESCSKFVQCMFQNMPKH